MKIKKSIDFFLRIYRWSIYILLIGCLSACIISTESSEIPEIKKLAIPPSPPTEIEVSELSAFTAKISWKAPVDTGSEDGKVSVLGDYQLQYSSDIQFTNPITYYVPENTYSLSGLLSEHTYYVRVISTNNNSLLDKNISVPAILESSDSKGSFTTTTIPPLSPPTGVAVNAQVYEADVTWKPSVNNGATKNGELATIKRYLFEIFDDENYKNEVQIARYTKATKIDLKRLIPAHTYYIRLRTINSDNIVSNSVKYIFTTESLSSPSDAPTSMTITSNSGNSEIGLQWQKPNPGKAHDGINEAVISKYIISYDTNNNFSNAKTKEFLATGVATENIILSGLVGGETYYFKVKSVNSADRTSEDSSTVEVEVMPYAIAPSKAIISTILQGNTKSKAVVNWSAPSSSGTLPDGKTAAQIDHYVIEYALNDQFLSTSIDTKEIPNIDSNTNTIILENLLGAKTYYVRVKTYNTSKVAFSYSEIQTYEVPDRSEEPNNVTQVVADTPTKNSIEVDWISPNSFGFEADGVTDASITKYIVYYSTDDDFKVEDAEGNKEVTMPNSSRPGDVITETNIDGLNPFTTYYFKVIAVNSINLKSGNSATSSAMTLSGETSPERVNNFQSTKVACDEISTSWDLYKLSDNTGTKADGTKSTIVQYIVVYSTLQGFNENDNTEYELKRTFGTGDPSVHIPSSTTFDGLTPGITYYFKIASVNDVGLESPYTVEQSYTTLASCP